MARVLEGFHGRGRQGFLRRATLAACLPSARRVFFGRCAIVRLRLAASAALPMLRRAAAFCFAVAIAISFIMSTELAGQSTENSLVSRMPAGACSRSTRLYPRRAKKSAALVV